MSTQGLIVEKNKFTRNQERQGTDKFLALVKHFYKRVTAELLVVHFDNIPWLINK